MWFGLLIFLVALYVWHAVGAKELAFELTKERCEQMGLQLLDESIGGWKVSFSKSKSGQWRLQRFYTFEFTSTGEQRYQGYIVLVGGKLHHIEFDPHRV